MQRPIALFLCVLAQGAAAQCAASVAPAAMRGTHPAPAAQAQTPAKPELIKTAAAGTRDDAPPAVRDASRGANRQDHPRRGGTAMLLAALALMSGIALRRYGARDT